MKANKNEKLFTIFKRFNISNKEKTITRAISIASGLILSIIACSLAAKENIFDVIGTIVKGNTIDLWKLFLNTALLLAFGVAIVAPFKMKYWNMGSGGSVMMAALVSYYIINLVNSNKNVKIPNAVLLLIMFVASVTVGVLWSTIPAIFKAFFNTNETLFTLMFNYIATGFVAYLNYKMAKGSKANPGIISYSLGAFPTIINDALIPLIVIAALSVFISIYLNKTKHGYEIAVLGDSPKTAQYVGMKNKWITIRTLILSGVICGIIGFLYISCLDHMCSETTGGTLGFTGILVAWISNFNIPVMALVSLLLTFMTIGTEKVSSFYSIGNTYISNIALGIIFFAILIGEFFIAYRIKINRRKETK